MFQFNITNRSKGVNQCMCYYVAVQYYKSVPGSQSVYALLCFSSILQIGPGESISVCVVMFQFNITNWSRGVNQCMRCYVSVQYYKLVLGSESVYVLLCCSSILQIGPGESTLKRNFQQIQEHENKSHYARPMQVQPPPAQPHPHKHHHDRAHGHQHHHHHPHPQQQQQHQQRPSSGAHGGQRPVSSQFKPPTKHVIEEQLPKQQPIQPRLIGKHG